MSDPNKKHPEELVRENIDAQLIEAGWVVQDRKENHGEGGHMPLSSRTGHGSSPRSQTGVGSSP